MMIPLLTAVLAGTVLAQTPPSPLRVSMISLGVTDAARSLKFYRDVLGLQLVSEPEPGEVAIVKAGELTIVINHPLGQAAKQIVGATEVIFGVDSVTASYKNLVERGCKFIREPREVTSGTWGATLTDPDGHRLTILGPK